MTDSDAPQEVPGAEDVNWQSFFNVILVPNPRLSLSQQSIVAQDYCMTKGEISIAVRRSFLYYFQKRLRIDVARALDDPRETPVVVQNQDAFLTALTEANR